MWRYLIALPLLLHGLAHISGFVASLSPGGADYKLEPWIFSPNLYLHTGAGRIFGILWLIACLALIAAGVGVILHKDWWLTLAIIAAVISLLVIIPWWKSVPPGAKFGAFFDVLVIVVLLTPLQARLMHIVG